MSRSKTKYRKFMFRGKSAKRYARTQKRLILTRITKISSKLLNKWERKTAHLWLQNVILILMTRIVAATRRMMVAKCREVCPFLPL